MPQLLIAIFEPRYNQLAISAGSSSGKRKADEITEEAEDVGGWVYVGSHNFSSAAWVSLPIHHQADRRALST
jgi:tyrosyl-DNA phosphodiesterase-1